VPLGHALGVRPLGTRQRFNVSGGDTNVDVSATVGAIAITALSPTVTIDRDISATVGAIAITALNPTVTFDREVSAAAGAIAITALNPTVSIDRDIVADAGAITLTGHNPTVVIPTAVSIVANAGRIEITPHNPTVFAVFPATADPIGIWHPAVHARLNIEPPPNGFGDDPMNTNLIPRTGTGGKSGSKSKNLARSVGGVEKSASKAGKGKQTSRSNSSKKR